MFVLTGSFKQEEAGPTKSSFFVRVPFMKSFYAWVCTQTQAENTHLLCKGKYHCTADLLFDWSGSAVLLNWNYKQICLFGQILTGQSGGQPYSNISPYEVSEYSLPNAMIRSVRQVVAIGPEMTRYNKIWKMGGKTRQKRFKIFVDVQGPRNRLAENSPYYYKLL